ncbi:MAG: hypothetical protein ACJ766_14960 [Thermoleophilaceae bacterium]
MSLVHHPIRAQVARYAVLLLAVWLSGCFGSSHQPRRTGGATIADLRLADCTDWRQADVRQRYDTLHSLRDFAGGPAGPNPAGHGAVLDDDKAYKLFQNYCKQPFAGHFRLYHIYNRAASFTRP